MHGTLRHVAPKRRDTRNPIQTQAVCQRIHHTSETVARLLRSDIGKLGLRHREWCHGLGFQHDHLDAEAWIDGVQFLAQQFGQIGGIARRQCSAHRDLRHNVIDAEEPRDETLAAFVLLCQPPT